MAHVANQRIWAPWRLKYVKGAKDDAGGECIFCAKPGAGEEHDAENLIVHRGELCFVILNKFPYTNGHLMIAPYAHVATLPELDPATVAEMMSFAQKGMTMLEEVYSPQGYNVPRWGGDTNFMPVLADTRVMPQSLEQSYEALAGSFD